MTPEHPLSIVELRQYTLYPGMRDELVALFDREFVETQEAAGISVIGQFRDLDRDDRFVWLRGFGDMPARARALGAFYGGPVWATHRETANATMVDSDDVLLLRPAGGARPAGDAAGGGLVVATICHLCEPAERAFLDTFEQVLVPALRASGVRLLGSYVSEPAANTYPALAVREGAQVLVWLASYATAAEHRAKRAAFERSAAAGELKRDPVRTVETLRLEATPGSRLR